MPAQAMQAISLSHAHTYTHLLTLSHTCVSMQAMLRCAKTVTMPHNGQPTTVRVGMHTGPVVTGLIGTKLPKFSVFGEGPSPGAPDNNNGMCRSWASLVGQVEKVRRVS